MTSETRDKVLILVAVGFALTLGSSLLIAVINLGSQIASVWLLLLVQVAVGILVLSITFVVIGAMIKWLLEKFGDLYWKHEELLRQLKQRTPWFVALTVLIAQAVLEIAGNAFRDESLPTVAVTLVLILLFYIANELITREVTSLKVLGFIVWFAAVVGLPMLIIVDRGFSFKTVLLEIAAFPLLYKVFYSVAFLLFVLTPLLFISKREARR